MNPALGPFENSLEGFKQWAIAIGHYPAIKNINSFEMYLRSLENGKENTGTGTPGTEVNRGSE